METRVSHDKARRVIAEFVRSGFQKTLINRSLKTGEVEDPTVWTRRLNDELFKYGGTNVGVEVVDGDVYLVRKTGG